MDWLRKPFGLTIEQQAETYSNELKDDRSGVKDWDAGDMLRDVFTPGTREELEAAAKEFKEKKINELSSKRRGSIKESLGGTGIDSTGLTIGTKETETDYDTRLSGLETRGAANVNNLAIEGYDPSKVTAGMSASEIVRLGTTQKTTNRDAAETKAQGREDKIREDGKTERAEIRSSDRQYQADQLAHSEKMRRLDNKHATNLSILSGDRQMAIAQMEQDIRNKQMDYDRETRRLDKRSQAIAQLLSGLGPLGGAFSL